MATATPSVSSTKETTNYARLCRLLVNVGTQALRDTFDAIHSPANLHTVLVANTTTLQPLRRKKVINATQWGKLFPAIPTSVSSAHFDITLLMILLRNICSLPSPVAGWDTLPAVTEVSREADIARVKYYRNTVYGHAECASVDYATFNTYWSDIRDTLVRLGGMKYKAAIDNLETECMDPEAEDHCKEALSQWKKDEDNVKDKLDEVIKKLDALKIPGSSPEKEPGVEGKSIESEELPESTAMCRERLHETEPINYYCKNCKVCICDRCKQTRHSYHIKVSIQQAVEEEKLKMIKAVEEVNIQIEELEMQIQKTTELFRVSKEKIVAARNNVYTTVEELVRVLKEHEKSLVIELDVIERRQERDHLLQLEHLQASLQELKGSVQSCEAILARNVCIETLQARLNEIEKSSGVLKETKVDVFKPCYLCYQKNIEYFQKFMGAAPGELLVSKTDPMRSVVKGCGLQSAEAGRRQNFDIITNNSKGEQCHCEIDEIKVKVRCPTGKDLDSEIDDWDLRGTYVAGFTPVCEGEHLVTVSINGQPIPESPWIVCASPHQYRFNGNFEPPEKVQLKEPRAIAIDNKTCNLAVADRKKQRVRLFSSMGKYLTDLGQKGSAAKKLTDPTSVAFTPCGDIIVISSGTISRFTVSGQLIERINNKHLKFPFSLSVTRDGRLVVCDRGNKSVNVLSPDGTELLQSFSAPDCTDFPWEAVWHQDMFFVSYSRARCVKTFNKDGDLLYDIGNGTSRKGQLHTPRGLAIDFYNNLVVCDEETRSLNVFRLDGTFVNMATSDWLDCPWSIAVNSKSRWLFVIDPNNDCGVAVFW